MEKIVGLEALKEKLSEIENLIAVAIAAELARINRAVAIAELNYNPFNQNVAGYIEAIRLGENSEAVLDTSFNDTKEKALSSCISDSEIDHWNLLGLLEQLQWIKTKK